MNIPRTPVTVHREPDGDDLTSFQIDGNPDGPDDWNAPYGPGTTPQGNATSGLVPFGSSLRNGDPCDGSTDDIFSRSSQLAALVMDNPEPLLGSSPPAPVNKGDLCAAYAASELVDVDRTYHTVIYGAWERGAVPGEVTFFIPLADSTPGNGPGDRIIEFDYDSRGGDDARVRALVDRNGVGPGPELSSGVFQGAVEDGGQPSFGEFALDLTEAGVLPEGGPCTSLTEKYAFTRTGNSETATLIDYVGIDLPPITNCATLVVDKVATPVPDASSSEDFGFTVFQRDDGAIRPGVDELDGTLRVPSAPATHPEVGDPVTIEDILASPDYVVEENLLPDGWTQESLICTGTNPLTGNAFTQTLFPLADPESEPQFPVGPGATVTCTITNLGPPSVDVTKTVLPASVGDWSVDFTISPVPDGETATKTATDDASTVTWNGLLPGTEYTVTEGAMPGFAPEPGEPVSCAVTNTADEVVDPEEEVDEEVVSGEEEEIAATGANAVPLAAVGIWLALIGAALVMIASRRRRA